MGYGGIVAWLAIVVCMGGIGLMTHGVFKTGFVVLALGVLLLLRAARHMARAQAMARAEDEAEDEAEEKRLRVDG